MTSWRWSSVLPPSTSTRRQIGGLVSSSVTLSWNTSAGRGALVATEQERFVRRGRRSRLASGSVPPRTAARARSGEPSASFPMMRLDMRSESASRSCWPSFQSHSPWNANSFITPTTRRSFVGAIRTSLMALRSVARNVSSTPCRRRTASIAAGARSSRVAAGASSMNTGSSVRLLTSSATCGRQNSALANQSPSAVVDSSSSAAGAPFTRSRSFLVPRITSTRPSLAPPARLLRRRGDLMYRNARRGHVRYIRTSGE